MSAEAIAIAKRAEDTANKTSGDIHAMSKIVQERYDRDGEDRAETKKQFETVYRKLDKQTEFTNNQLVPTIALLGTTLKEVSDMAKSVSDAAAPPPHPPSVSNFTWRDAAVVATGVAVLLWQFLVNSPPPIP